MLQKRILSVLPVDRRVDGFLSGSHSFSAGVSNFYSSSTNYPSSHLTPNCLQTVFAKGTLYGLVFSTASENPLYLTTRPRFN